MAENYYTVEQISEMLDMHPKTIQRYIREGKLRAVKIGKGWRVTGHDLSVFTENSGTSTSNPDHSTPKPDATASSVVDIVVKDKDAAIRIMNTLTAGLNAKPPEFGRSSLHVQYLEEAFMVRLTLWGGIRFMAAMMDAVIMLTENSDEE